METATATKSTITLFDRANSQLLSTLFQHSQHYYLYIFPELNKSPHAMLVIICIVIDKTTCLVFHGGDPLSLSPLLKCTTHSLTMFTFTGWSPEKFNKYQWMLMGTVFFCMEKFSDTPLLHTQFHVRCHAVRLPLCCHLSHGDNV